MCARHWRCEVLLVIESTQSNRKTSCFHEVFNSVRLNSNLFLIFFRITVPLTDDNFKKWRADFFKCEKNVLAQNVCSRVDPFEAALSRKVLENTQHVFTYKVESEGKPLTNQKNSGRCWLFAALNSIRIPFMKNVSVAFWSRLVTQSNSSILKYSNIFSCFCSLVQSGWIRIFANIPILLG